MAAVHEAESGASVRTSHGWYEASAVKRGLPRDRSGAELLLVVDGRCPSNLVSGRIGRSGTTIPGIREGQLRGGGTILSSTLAISRIPKQIRWFSGSGLEAL